MGEARRRAALPVEIVYHHTSTLRTNLIWMSGVIDIEGRSEGCFHPLLGEIKTEVRARRAAVDFPPLAWFTRDIRIPKVLLESDMLVQPKEGGPPQYLSDMLGDEKMALIRKGFALHRVALGFPLAGSTIIPWPEHPGYFTGEGDTLNRTARDVGDDPNRWYVSDQPVDVLTASEIWTSGSIFEPRLERQPSYLPEVHRMVSMCRQFPGMYIGPTWASDPACQEMMAKSKFHNRTAVA